MKYSVTKIKEFPLEKKRLARKIGLRTFAKMCAMITMTPTITKMFEVCTV